MHAVGTAFILSLFSGCSLNKPPTKAYEKAEQSESHTAKLFRDMFISQKKQTEISEMREIIKRFPLEESKSKAEQSESHTAKLFRDMFITQKEQTEISEMREIMKRFPLKESK